MRNDHAWREGSRSHANRGRPEPLQCSTTTAPADGPTCGSASWLPHGASPTCLPPTHPPEVEGISEVAPPVNLKRWIDIHIPHPAAQLQAGLAQQRGLAAIGGACHDVIEAAGLL